MLVVACTHAARPLYEVVVAAKVRQLCEQTSRFVTQLAMGTRLHVVEIRRTVESIFRVRVVVIGQQDPLGWITARRADGLTILRDIDKMGSTRAAADGPFGTAVCSVNHRRLPHRAPSSDHERLLGAPSPFGMARAAAPSLRGGGAERPLVERRQFYVPSPFHAPVHLPAGGPQLVGGRMPSAAFGTSISTSRRRQHESAPIVVIAASSASQPARGQAHGRCGSGSAGTSEDASAAQTRPSSDLQNSQTAATAAAATSGPPRNAWQAKLMGKLVSNKAGTATNKSGGGSANLSSLSAVALETMAFEMLKQQSNWLSSTELDALATEQQAKAVGLCDSRLKHKSVAVQLGEVLGRRKIKVAELMREWDPK